MVKLKAERTRILLKIKKIIIRRESGGSEGEIEPKNTLPEGFSFDEDELHLNYTGDEDIKVIRPTQNVSSGEVCLDIGNINKSYSELDIDFGNSYYQDIVFFKNNKIYYWYKHP